MEKEFAKTKRLVNKILKQLGDATLDWTVQVNENSADPNHRTYACMIHVPSERLEPLTWVKDSWEDLHTALEKATKDLNRDLIDIAEHDAEIKRCKRLIKYHEEKIAELTKES